ncbi:Vacuolar protein sorting-associated protein vts1 [Colletotrichum spinosum]|uniref:Vacuolar protein sorting-associated protein vts1 n=1 Tax=Colletotrichum spinosum TaxID=1347390 RepID=A0A4R8Q3X8_9PEZI|nr:Vacuolar protein sorting-associated protein vts1 [Colletotrichum spinosum]
MADPIPDSLRQADITRFINRANQLRQHKPAITYWCEYWVTNQILAKQLHNVDEESLAYTTNLMDRLERTKTENAGEEAITDDTVGQAYVEQFAQETLDRAEKVMRANRVTRQTADTFDAAATFFLLNNIWGQIDEETQKKVKYAKWNAARILKAIREGNDPNESNPKQEPEPEETLPTLDPNDLDVLGLTSPPPKPTVEDDPETEFYKQAPATAPSEPPQASAPSAPEAAQSSVLELPSVPTSNEVQPPPAQLQGYFDPPDQFPPSPLSQTGANDPSGAANAPSAPSPYAASSTGPSFSPANATSPWQPPPQIPPPSVAKNTPSTAIAHQSKPPPVQQQPKASVVSIVNNSWKPDSGPTDDLDLPKAQKHAKWAISALNFEDVPTAVKELRNALAALGVQ